MTKPVQKDNYYAVAHRSDEEIASFATRYDVFDAEKVIAPIFKQKLGLKVESFDQSGGWGSSHVIYFVYFKDHRDLVFRANLGVTTPEVEMVIEKLVTEKVQGIAVPTNTVLVADISRSKYPFDYQIQEVLAGRDPESDFDGSQTDYEKIVFETGQAIAKYSAIRFEGFGRFDVESAMQGELRGVKEKFSDYVMLNVEDDLEGLLRHDIIKDKRASDALTFLQDRKDIMNAHNPASLVHHDLADHNLMYEGNKLVGVFDWETAIAGDPILDIASCPTWRSHYPKREALIAGYESITTLPTNFEELEKIYRLRTALWKGYYMVRMDIVNDTRRAMVESAFKNCNL